MMADVQNEIGQPFLRIEQDNPAFELADFDLTFACESFQHLAFFFLQVDKVLISRHLQGLLTPEGCKSYSL